MICRRLATLAIVAVFAALGAATSSPESGQPDPAGPAAATPVARAAQGPVPPPETGTINGVGAAVRRRTADGWATERFAHADNGEMPRDVFTAGSDVYATGYAYTGVPGPDNGVVWKRTPEGWTEVFRLTLKELGDGWASGPSDVWVAGAGVAHFDGTSWSEVDVPRIQMGSYRVSGSSADNVLLFGSDGTVRRRDASGQWTEWLHVTLPGSEWLMDALVIDATHAVATCSEGSVIRITDGQPTVEPSGVHTQLSGVWASGPSDIYVAAGSLLHSSGDGRWTPVAIPDLGQVTDVRGTSASDIWALGLGGMAHYDGTTWTPMAWSALREGAEGAMDPTGIVVAGGETLAVFDVMNM